MQKSKLYILLLLLNSFTIHAQNTIKVYLIPGQGSDTRIYKNISFNEDIDTVHIKYPMPLQDETMHQYAERIAEQIDTTEQFSIIGVSLGGMIACELTDILHPQKIILISSASCSEEIPQMYKFFKKFPIYKDISPAVFRYSGFILQPLYEPDRKLEKETCVNMLQDKDALFLKRAVQLIVSWDRIENDNYNKNIVHIHGDIDNTLPIENVKADYIISGGSHMMTLTKAEEISLIINKELHQN